MTDRPTPDTVETSSAAARQARVAKLARGRVAKRRHPAQGARIAAAGLGATTMLGLVGVMGYATRPTSTPNVAPVALPLPQIVVVVHRPGAPDVITTTADLSDRPTTVLSARPTVRAASPQPQAPAASTNGST